MILLRGTDSKLYRLISKKLIYFLTTLFFASIPSVLISCELQQILNIRNVILERTNAPINTLIEIHNGEISFLIKKNDINNLAQKGNETINVYSVTKSGLILKKRDKYLINSELLSKINDLQLELQKFDKIIISPLGLFIFARKEVKNLNHNCLQKMDYFIKHRNGKYKYFEGNESNQNKSTEPYYLSYNEAIYLILVGKTKLTNYSNEIQVDLNVAIKRSLASKIENSLKKENLTTHRLKLLHSDFGIRMSHISIPIIEYKVSKNFKDANALYYLSRFSATKDPKLIHGKFNYSTSLVFEKKNTKIKVNFNYPIHKALDFKFETNIDKNKNVNISRTYLTNKYILNHNNLLMVRLGKMSLTDYGLLFSNQNFNLASETVINVSGYTAINNNCSSCINNAVSTGIEKYYPIWDMKIGGNYTIQNFKNKIENLTELTFKKELSSLSSFNVTARYDIKNNFASELDLNFTIPLGSKKPNSTFNKNNIYVKFQSKSGLRLTSWTRDDNNFIFKNTPNYLKRNWNNYMSFD